MLASIAQVLEQRLSTEGSGAVRPARFAELGARLDAAGQAHDGPLALIELQNGAAEPSYVAGTENFYVITRYNWSSYYAMAVIELGQEVAAALGA